MQTETALRLARWAHGVFPFGQLRTARRILDWNENRPLRLRTRIFGYEVELDAHRSSTHVLLYLQREKFVEDAIFLQPHVRPGMTVFDVGANIGYLTYFFCRHVGPSGKVYAFEPDADNYNELSRNIRFNDVRFCYPQKVVVGARDDEVAFTSGLNGFVNIDKGIQANARMTSLDSFVIQGSIARVDLVKIDVEGYELEVLEGMSSLVCQSPQPILYIEVHPAGLCGVAKPTVVWDWLERKYNRILIYRVWGDVRGRLHLVSRLMTRKSADVTGKCRVGIEEARRSPDCRFQALCQPN